jgi:hypothetical protein
VLDDVASDIRRHYLAVLRVGRGEHEATSEAATALGKLALYEPIRGRVWHQNILHYICQPSFPTLVSNPRFQPSFPTSVSNPRFQPPFPNFCSNPRCSP